VRNWALPAADSYFRPHLNDLGFQVEHLLVALKYVRHWDVAIDGGAHIGTWSVEMAKHFRDVYPFEPALDTFECLKRNTGGLLNVWPSRAALGSSRTYGKLVDDPKREGNTGARYMRMTGIGDVLIRTIDDFVAEHLAVKPGTPERRVGFIKLDLEGAEQLALCGAALTLSHHAPVVMLEVKDFRDGRFPVDPLDAVRHLVKLGYREAERVRNDRIFVAG
jgi:FkbM family methyltransferase